jgi:hypothetical protein
MQQLKNTPASTLYWIQPSWGRPTYELRSDDEIFCLLQCPPHITDPVFIISADGQWTLKYQWPWAVRIMKLEEDIAFFRFKKSTLWPVVGTLEFTNGSRLRWHNINLRLTRWAFSSEDNLNLLYFKQSEAFSSKLTVRVDLTPKLKDMPEASMLAALGLYLWSQIITGGVLLTYWGVTRAQAG